MASVGYTSGTLCPQKWSRSDGTLKGKGQSGHGKVAGSGSTPAGGMGTVRAGSLETIQVSSGLWLLGSASSPNHILWKQGTFSKAGSGYVVQSKVTKQPGCREKEHKMGFQTA